MDPRIHPERHGVVIDMTVDQEEIHHIDRFRNNLAKGAPATDSAAETGKAPNTPSNFTWREMRQSPRLRCSGSVDFRTAGCDDHLWGTLTDISLHGCYVEIESTVPVGTTVYLVLKSFGIRIQAQGIVRASILSTGMGIGFTEIEPGQQTQLNHLLNTLTRRPAGGSLAAVGKKSDMGPVDPIAFLDEITEFFRKKPLLSREEFQQIADRVRRP